MFSGLVLAQYKRQAGIREEVYDRLFILPFDPLVNRDTVESETAPSGMIGRGHYEAVSKFIDDDNQTHLQFKWSFDIKKDW